jgi:hypothetical protein
MRRMMFSIIAALSLDPYAAVHIKHRGAKTDESKEYKEYVPHTVSPIISRPSQPVRNPA